MKNGGPAFPRTGHESLTYEDLGAKGADPQQGMSLRDYFAAAWLQGSYICGGVFKDADDIARECYRQADAMLAAREKQNG